MEVNNNMAWYRKYRPVSIDDYMGDSIKHMVNARFTDKNALPQVIMLHGNRGCGKTSFARIVTKYYLCESPVDGKPCEECEICRLINDALINGAESGVEVPGVTEVDATTANGKEAIQNIIDDAIIAPMFTKYKIIILDECHMITPQAQNSLLKIIEDVPSHLVVIFATTDPEKVLGTIHSRCQVKLEVKKKTVDELAQRLMYIAKQEGLTTSMEALKIIAKQADRVPREAINLLESIAKSYGNNVTVESVRESTGSVSAELYMEYYEKANEGLEDILLFTKKLKELDISPRDFFSGLTRFTIDCLYIRHGINLEDHPVEYIKKVKKLFDTYNSSEFDVLLQIIENSYGMIGNDEPRNELAIINTALRVSKLDMLSRGLDIEFMEAEKENKMSISEYQKICNKEMEDRKNKLGTFAPTKEKLVGILGGMKDVVGVDVNIESNVAIDVVKEDEDKKDGDGKFYTPEELEKMLEN